MPRVTQILEVTPARPLGQCGCRVPGNQRTCAWCSRQRRGSKCGPQEQSAHGPPQLPPGTERPPLTCPCTMAFSRASTACRASGGRSGCSKSETAFQSASTACCPAKKGQGLVCWPLNLRDSSMGKGQRRTTWSFNL